MLVLLLLLLVCIPSYGLQSLNVFIVSNEHDYPTALKIKFYLDYQGFKISVVTPEEFKEAVAKGDMIIVLGGPLAKETSKVSKFFLPWYLEKYLIEKEESKVIYELDYKPMGERKIKVFILAGHTRNETGSVAMENLEKIVFTMNDLLREKIGKPLGPPLKTCRNLEGIHAEYLYYGCYSHEPRIPVDTVTRKIVIERFIFKENGKWLAKLDFKEYIYISQLTNPDAPLQLNRFIDWFNVENCKLLNETGVSLNATIYGGNLESLNLLNEIEGRNDSNSSFILNYIAIRGKLSRETVTIETPAGTFKCKLYIEKEGVGATQKTTFYYFSEEAPFTGLVKKEIYYGSIIKPHETMILANYTIPP